MDEEKVNPCHLHNTYTTSVDYDLSLIPSALLLYHLYMRTSKNIVILAALAALTLVPSAFAEESSSVSVTTSSEVSATPSAPSSTGADLRARRQEINDQWKKDHAANVKEMKKLRDENKAQWNDMRQENQKEREEFSSGALEKIKALEVQQQAAREAFRVDAQAKLSAATGSGRIAIEQQIKADRKVLEDKLKAERDALRESLKADRSNLRTTNIDQRKSLKEENKAQCEALRTKIAGQVKSRIGDKLDLIKQLPTTKRDAVLAKVNTAIDQRISTANANKNQQLIDVLESLKQVIAEELNK